MFCNRRLRLSATTLHIEVGSSRCQENVGQNSSAAVIAVIVIRSRKHDQGFGKILWGLVSHKIYKII